MEQAFIRVKTNFEGYHRWPEATGEQEFLRYPHRHIFYVTATISVHHQDRELEFFAVKSVLNAIITKMNAKRPDFLSCENMGYIILHALQDQYGCDRSYHVEVSEDNENSSVIISPPDFSPLPSNHSTLCGCEICEREREQRAFSPTD